MLFYGDFNVLRDDRDIFTYSRTYKGITLVVDVNLRTDHKKMCEVRDEYEIMLKSDDDTCDLNAYKWRIYGKKRA